MEPRKRMCLRRRLLRYVEVLIVVWLEPRKKMRKYREIKNKAQEPENKIGVKNTLKKHVYFMRYKIRDVKNNFLT